MGVIDFLRHNFFPVGVVKVFYLSESYYLSTRSVLVFDSSTRNLASCTFVSKFFSKL